MAHPMARRSKSGKQRAKARFADGGAIDNSIDVSTPSPTQYPYSLGQKMQDVRSSMDIDEMKQGKRFMDYGSRIPGSQKARNDAYMSKRK